MNPELETYLALTYGPFAISADWFLQLPEPVMNQLYMEFCRPVCGFAHGRHRVRAYRVALAIYVFASSPERRESSQQRVYQLLAEYHERV